MIRHPVPEETKMIDRLTSDSAPYNPKQKEAYFTPETIDTVTGSILKRLKPLIQPDRCPFVPDQAALLVLDMQQYFLDPQCHAFLPSAPAIVPVINRLIESFHTADRPVILTRHINTPANAGNMGRWWKRIITAEDPAGDIDPMILSRNGLILNKTRFDAFWNTDLFDLLTAANVRSLVITGVMTHICCDTTARSAFLHGFDVFFVVDGTATYNLEFHESSLLTLSHACVRPVRECDVRESV